jgi:hypothetical protein
MSTTEAGVKGFSFESVVCRVKKEIYVKQI